MGSTRRNQSNTTNQVDSRQIHETVNETEQRVEDSFNTETRFDVQDESQGNISAGGNVTVESEAASIASSEASQALGEANAALQAQLAEEQRRTAEINADLERDRTDANRQIAEANAQLQADLAEQQRRTSEAALSTNANVANNAISQTRRASEQATQAVVDISEEALKRNSLHVAEVLTAGNDNLTATLDFLEDDEAQDRKLLESNFEFLGDTIQEANTLTTTAVTEAFKSTVGGLADEQQQTLLIGLAIIAALAVLITWRKSS